MQLLPSFSAKMSPVIFFLKDMNRTAVQYSYLHFLCSVFFFYFALMKALSMTNIS